MLSLQGLIVVALVHSSVAQQKPSAVQYEWKYVNFTWPSGEAYRNAVKSSDYIKEHNALAGIKLWKGRLYLTIPRWKTGVPATLLVTSAKPANGVTSPALRPYPSWEMQQVGNCSALQFVQSMEIDPLGRMWVIDSGRVATLSGSPRNYCPPRLVLLDLEDGGRVLLSHVFPESVANRSSVYLNDIVLDHADGGYAYISNTDDREPSLVVFSLRSRSSWKVTHPSMKATSVRFTVKHDGTRVRQALNVDGLALSPASQAERALYYSPLSSLEVFCVPASALRARPGEAGSSVRRLGGRPSQTDGMIMSAAARLYFGLLADNAVASWDERRPPFERNQHAAFADDRRMQWPDTFAIDERGVLWAVSNRLQRFLADELDTSEPNFRVLRLTSLGSRSYLYYENGEAPPFPAIG